LTRSFQQEGAPLPCGEGLGERCKEFKTMEFYYKMNDERNTFNARNAKVYAKDATDAMKRRNRKNICCRKYGTVGNENIPTGDIGTCRTAVPKCYMYKLLIIN
jgi:hypothetical protein